MISYALKCENDHRFDSWFKSADAFDKLQASGMLTCTICGSQKVEKNLMAPQVRASRDKTVKPLSGEKSPAEQALAELKKKVEENSEYVGKDFAREAREIHDGLKPERPIYGEARLDEAKKLAEDGVPVMPLPFMPDRKSN